MTTSFGAWGGSKPLFRLILAGSAVLLVLAVGPDVSRTQEARVLETAREMVGRPLHDWLVPRCNGHVRLQKPPLAYWLSALSFSALGVNDLAGRLPAVLASLATIMLTWRIGRSLFNERVAFLAGATLFTSFFFLRFGHVAETDCYVLFFNTAAVAAFLSAAAAITRASRVLAYHAAALAIAGSAMTKGPPALLPLVFLVAYALAERRPRLLLDFLLSGAMATLALVTLPWLLYVADAPAAAVLRDELGAVAGRRDHRRPVWEYLPTLFLATLPWSGLLGLALVAAIPKWRAVPPLRPVLIWAATIFVTLSLTPKKQEHYLLPILPPLMLLVGWCLDRAASGDAPLARAAALILMITLGVGTGVAMAVPFIGHAARGGLRPLDLTVAGAIVPAMAFLSLQLAVDGLESALRFAPAVALLLLALLIGLWEPSLHSWTPRTVAADVRRRYPDAPLALYEDDDLPLCYYLRQTMHVYGEPDELRKAAADHPGLLVVWDTDPSRPGHLVPRPPGTELARYSTRKRIHLLIRP